MSSGIIVLLYLPQGSVLFLLGEEKKEIAKVSRRKASKLRSFYWKQQLESCEVSSRTIRSNNVQTPSVGDFHKFLIVQRMSEIQTAEIQTTPKSECKGVGFSEKFLGLLNQRQVV